ncbi:PRC-barrel domain-containing protein [Actinacidiphila paucisporea]|uniref:PRC-barrel domain-containing protein n=1 Tax=Actinacidiphila paucisporea TaxID=310782 RepID=A0A1M7QZT8_9ACTN|nr:PRC-barrel domain-containing protein [Actinacidiphila paucisporea]SHN37825.1 PRC-barrel domain-containing protein [Actinacidiphila paucisporea]
MQTDIDPRSLIGRRAFDRDGTRIGTVDEVYLDDATGTPEWAAVRTGLFTRDALVPLEPSELVDDALRVPYKKSLIRDAPDFGVGRHLSPEQELQLYHHYGMDVPRVSDREQGGARDFGELANGDRRPGGNG